MKHKKKLISLETLLYDLTLQEQKEHINNTSNINPKFMIKF